MSGRTFDRETLHQNKAEDFASWCVSKGYTREATPHAAKYEALRLRSRDGGPPILYFRRDGSPHLSCDARGWRLVKRWLQSRRDRLVSEVRA